MYLHACKCVYVAWRREEAHSEADGDEDQKDDALDQAAHVAVRQLLHPRLTHLVSVVQLLPHNHTHPHSHVRAHTRTHSSKQGKTDAHAHTRAHTREKRPLSHKSRIPKAWHAGRRTRSTQTGGHIARRLAGQLHTRQTGTQALREGGCIVRAHACESVV